MRIELTPEEQKAIEDDLKEMGYDDDKDQFLMNTDEGPRFVDCGLNTTLLLHCEGNPNPKPTKVFQGL